MVPSFFKFKYVFLFVIPIILVISGCSDAVKACFTFSPETPTVSSPVTFDASCSENSYLYIWNFGDGTVDTTVTQTSTVTHVYTTTDTYTVTLTAESKDGVTFRKGDFTTTQTLEVQ